MKKYKYSEVRRQFGTGEIKEKIRYPKKKIVLLEDSRSPHNVIAMEKCILLDKEQLMKFKNKKVHTLLDNPFVLSEDYLTIRFNRYKNYLIMYIVDKKDGAFKKDIDVSIYSDKGETGRKFILFDENISDLIEII